MLNGNSTHLCPNWLKQHNVVVFLFFLKLFFHSFSSEFQRQNHPTLLLRVDVRAIRQCST